MSGPPKRKPSAAALMIGLGGQHRIAPEILRNRYAERDARQASDDRTDVQKWLGDPPANRSALALGSQRAPGGPNNVLQAFGGQRRGRVPKS
jgi:hypothetical protein